MNVKRLFPFIVSFVLLIAVLFINQKTLTEMNDYTTEVDYAKTIINSLEELSGYLKSAEMYTPSYPRDYKRLYSIFKEDAEAIPSEISKLKALTKDSYVQRIPIDSISDMISREYDAMMQQNLSEMIASGEAWRLDRFFRIHRKIKEVINDEERRLAQRKEKLDKSANRSRYFTVAFSVIAFGLTVSSLFYNVVLMRKRQWLEGFLESVLNTSQNGIIHFKAVREHGYIKDFKVAFANAAIKDQLGVHPEKLIGSKLNDLDIIKQGSDEYKSFVAVANTGDPARFEMFYDLNDRKEWFFIMLAKMEDGLTATLQRITDIKKYQEDLTNNIRQLEQSNVELEQYAYVASHDLQEPLRKIRTYGNMLQGQQKEMLNDKGKIYVDKIVQSAERLTKLIKDILNVSGLKREVSFVTTDLNKVIENVMEDIDLTIDQRGATIHQENLPVIEAIPLQMNQLFYNLLINALKFSRPGVNPVITITSRLLAKQELHDFKNLNQKLSHYEIIVCDNGIGFSPQYSKQIFGLFKKLNDQQLYPGSGIGLALCQKVVTNHHGEIFANSAVGQGAAFHIILPVSQ